MMLAHSGHIMTLANSIIGVGILAMPFCFLKCGIVLSIVLLVVSNWVTRLCCHYLIKSSLLTRRKCIEFLGFHAFGPSGKLLVELCIIGYLLGTCITYFVVVGDLGPQIVTRMFALEDGHIHLRTIIMIAVTLICILPLGMLKNVDSLSTVCTASIGFYICFVIKIILESKEHMLANDWSERVVYWQPSGILQCLPIFSMALSCQMQIFEVFSTVNNQSLEKLNGIVRNSTWICTFVYVAVGFFGYVAFCTQPFSGNILLNFSTSFSSDVIKIGFIMSVAFSFPLVIFPCRASLYSLLYRKGHADASSYIPESRFKAITVFIVAFSLCIALMIPSVELIIGLVGSTIGVAICIMFPASCFRKIVRKESTERLSAQFVLAAGFCLMILGTYANLSAIDEKRSGVHTVPLNIQVQPTIADNFIPIEKIELLPEKLKQDKKEIKIEKPNNEVNAKLTYPPPALVVGAPAAIINQSQVDNNVLPVGPMQDPKVDVNPIVKEVNKEDAQNSVVIKQADNSIKRPTQKDEDKKKEEKVVMPIQNQIESKLSNSNNDAVASPTPMQMPNEIKSDQKSQPQTIAKDAIQNNDDVAAEESKDAPIKTDDELKKTQNELKKTKELLERTVDELKEELAKQNKETQNLVVEKLGEVVEKVEQIERKVQKSDVEHTAPIVAAAAANVENVIGPVKANDKSLSTLEVNSVSAKSGSLLTRLAENVNNNNSIGLKAPPKPGDVYEPLSYKTGELIEHAMNGTKVEQRLPLPLALLINAAQSKMNSTLGTKTSTAADTKLDAQVNAKEVAKSSDIDLAKSKDNVEAIRRDILQLNVQKQHDATTIMPVNDGNALEAKADVIAQRVKRASELNEIGNYLSDPKVEMLMAHGMSNALDLEKQNFGRDLKSIQETDST